MPYDDIWLRIKEQNLSVLPETGAVLFGIRIERIRLNEVLANDELRSRFHHTLQSMPPAAAAYKGMSDVKSDLLVLSG